MDSDEGLQMFMRRENLDAFWGLEQNTVDVNLGYFRSTRRHVLEGQLFLNSLLPLGPFLLKHLLKKTRMC